MLVMRKLEEERNINQPLNAREERNPEVPLDALSMLLERSGKG